jgi:hypothetical protein
MNKKGAVRLLEKAVTTTLRTFRCSALFMPQRSSRAFDCSSLRRALPYPCRCDPSPNPYHFAGAGAFDILIAGAGVKTPLNEKKHALCFPTMNAI